MRGQVAEPRLQAAELTTALAESVPLAPYRHAQAAKIYSCALQPSMPTALKALEKASFLGLRLAIPILQIGRIVIPTADVDM